LAKGGGGAQGAISVPQASSTTGEGLVGQGDDGTIDLDEIEYGMLLGVVERYWVWSESQKY
jgi:hypothetical protein